MKYAWDLLKGNELEAERDFSRLEKKTQIRELVEENCIEGYLYAKWKKKLPTNIYQICKDQYIIQWARNTLQLKTLEQIQADLKERQIDAVGLKGSFLLGRVYQDLGARSMMDIDILVRPRDFNQVKHYLESNDFKIDNRDIWSANQFKLNFWKIIEGVEIVVEVHSKLLNQNEDWDYQIREGGFLSLADNLVHLIGHLAYQHTFYKIHWLVDIELFFRKYRDEIDWNRVFELIERNNLKRSFVLTFMALKNNFNIEFDSKIEKKIDQYRDRIVSLGLRFLTPRFLWETVEMPFHYYLIKHCTKDKLRVAFSYDIRWMKRKLWIRSKKNILEEQEA